MMRFLGRVLTLILAVIFGFWLATSNILSGTTVGDWLDTLMDVLPASSGEWARLEITLPDNLMDSFNGAEDSEAVIELPETDKNGESNDVNYDLVESEILRLLNELRSEQGLNTLEPNEALRQAGNVRAQETEELFSHTRPDGRDAFTVFDDGITYNYQIVGENLGMATYYLEEEEMAELLFNGWVESEGHYENMIRPDYEEIGIGVHYDGEHLYATQLFGTQM